MSSADGRPFRVVEHIATALVLVLGLVVAVAVVLVPRDVPGRQGAAREQTVASTPDGVGDDYYPAAGGAGYDARSYTVTVTYTPSTGVLAGSTVVALTALTALEVVHLDLLLAVSEVDGSGSSLAFTQHGSDLAVDLGSAAQPGDSIELTVAYAGQPANVAAGKDGPVYGGADDLLICGEPASAAAWFPSNDHPSDPATYDLTISVPRGVEAISAGNLISRGSDPSRAGRDLWHWSVTSPAPTYTTMLAVGQYDVETVPVSAGGTTMEAVYAVSAGLDDPSAAMEWLKASPKAVALLESHLGPYPVSTLGGLVPDLRLAWTGMETLGRPTYIAGAVGNMDVIYHELAHQWLGDTVTLHRWRDIFLNEALATYLQWVGVAADGGATPQEQFDSLYASEGRFWQQKLSDPGVSGMFTRVYDRGPMVVHALRVRMGEEAFWRFLRAWVSRTGPRSLDDWRAAAATMSPTDVTGLLAAWLDGTSKVAATRENGFG